MLVPLLRAVSSAVLPFAAAVLLLAPQGAAAQPGRTCTVQRIIDGDTFVCADGERVRLLLVNTPEMRDEPLGRLAREFVVGRMPPGTEVGLELDVEERDRYGRLLAYVRLPDGRLLNRVVARAGYAQVMVVPPNVDRVDEMREAVRAARREEAGLWGGQGFGEQGPPGGRERTGRRDRPAGPRCSPPSGLSPRM